MKKRILALALAGAMTAGLLAGCGGGAPAESKAPAESAAAGSGAPASEGGEILVGVLANTTGDNAVYGNAVQNGVMLYIDQLNEKGGINGKTVKAIAYDEKGDATEAVNAYNRLVDDGITALIGSVLTGATIAVADETYDMNMPQITASATAAGVTMLDPEKADSEIRTNVFRSCFIDPFQGEKMAQYAKEKLSAATAAVIFETGNDYAEGLKDSFVAKCGELGITVTNEEAYAKGDVDFKAQMTNVAASNPDVVFCPNYYEDSGMIVTQARQVGVTSTFLGGDGWGSIAKYASAEDLEGAVYCSGYAAGTPDVAQFENAYTAKYNEDVPNMFAPLGYDAAMLMCNALKAAEDAGLEAGTDEYKQAVIDAMKATKGLEGITGTYEFDEYNNPIKSAAMMKLEGGKEVFSEMF
ncbi:MAG: ABC transporter substrate-binding protein [Oscillospiraceae bacterium]|jgi:branched-chain amino acid transport system substrate-binding protein